MTLRELFALVGRLLGGRFLRPPGRVSWLEQQEPSHCWRGALATPVACWPSAASVPLVLRAYLYETRGELTPPAATRRVSVTILIPLLVLWVTESPVAFALLYGAALGLFLCYPFGADHDERRGVSS